MLTEWMSQEKGLSSSLIQVPHPMQNIQRYNYMIAKKRFNRNSSKILEKQKRKQPESLLLFEWFGTAILEFPDVFICFICETSLIVKMENKHWDVISVEQELGNVDWGRQFHGGMVDGVHARVCSGSHSGASTSHSPQQGKQSGCQQGTQHSKCQHRRKQVRKRKILQLLNLVMIIIWWLNITI